MGELPRLPCWRREDRTASCARIPALLERVPGVGGGTGFTLAQEPLVRDDIREGHLVAPLRQRLANPYTFWIVYPHHLKGDAHVQAFTRWIRECDQEHAVRLSELTGSQTVKAGPGTSLKSTR